MAAKFNAALASAVAFVKANPKTVLAVVAVIVVVFVIL